MIGRRSQNSFFFVKDIQFFLSALRRKEKYLVPPSQHIFFNPKCLFLSPSGWLTKLDQSASFLSPKSCHQSVLWQTLVSLPLSSVALSLSLSLLCRMCVTRPCPRLAHALVCHSSSKCRQVLVFSSFFLSFLFSKTQKQKLWPTTTTNGNDYVNCANDALGSYCIRVDRRKTITSNVRKRILKQNT